MCFFNKINKNQNNSQTSTAQPLTQSSQSQNNQSLFESLIKYSSDISPLTAEILKVIPILSIFFIGLGFFDFLSYTYRQGIALSLSFLTASNLEVLIILPIALLILIFILPLLYSIIIYMSLNQLKTLTSNLKLFLNILFILIIYFAFSIFIYFLYIANVAHNIPSWLFYVMIVYLFLLVIFMLALFIPAIFKWLNSEIQNKYISNKKSEYLTGDTKGFFLSALSLAISFLIVYLILFFSSKNSHYFFIMIFAVYYFFYALPLNFYLSNYFNKNSANFFIFSTLAIFIAIISVLFYFISSKPSFPFKMLKIGGNIPVYLLISQKYFNELIRHKTLKTKISILQKYSNNLNKYNINIPDTNILKWHNFKLLLKTPDDYYVKNKKIKNLIIIPAKFVYAKSYKKIEIKTTNKNNNQFYNNKYLTCLELLLKLNNCIPCADYNKQYCWQYKYGYFIK
jgi:hypothetical protein